MFKKIAILFSLFALCSGFYPAQDQANMANEKAVVIQSGSNNLFETAGVKIGEAYPNPAESFVEMKYTITDPDVRVRVVFHNLLGVRVADQSLNSGDSRLFLSTEKFIPGVYFYTVSINDQNVVTKKLIVKK